MPEPRLIRSYLAVLAAQLPARLVISATVQQAPTAGPIRSSLRAARRAGFTRANSATIARGSPNSATADSAARSGARPCRI